jgi:hypothetical protein
MMRRDASTNCHRGELHAGDGTGKCRQDRSGAGCEASRCERLDQTKKVRVTPGALLLMTG